MGRGSRSFVGARPRSLRSLAELRRTARLGRLEMDFAGSLLHMHANRILRSNARAQELVLYDFLARLYESQAARARKRA